VVDVVVVVVVLDVVHAVQSAGHNVLSSSPINPSVHCESTKVLHSSTSGWPLQVATNVVVVVFVAVVVVTVVVVLVAVVLVVVVLEVLSTQALQIAGQASRNRGPLIAWAHKASVAALDSGHTSGSATPLHNGRVVVVVEVVVRVVSVAVVAVVEVVQLLHFAGQWVWSWSPNKAPRHSLVLKLAQSSGSGAPLHCGAVVVVVVVEVEVVVVVFVAVVVVVFVAVVAVAVVAVTVVLVTVVPVLEVELLVTHEPQRPGQVRCRPSPTMLSVHKSLVGGQKSGSRTPLQNARVVVVVVVVVAVVTVAVVFVVEVVHVLHFAGHVDRRRSPNSLPKQSFGSKSSHEAGSGAPLHRGGVVVVVVVVTVVAVTVVLVAVVPVVVDVLVVSTHVAQVARHCSRIASPTLLFDLQKLALARHSSGSCCPLHLGRVVVVVVPVTVVAVVVVVVVVDVVQLLHKIGHLLRK
jgi:hypothetical protein